MAFIRFAWRPESCVGRQLYKSWLVNDTMVIEALRHFDVLSIAHRSGVVVVVMSAIHRGEFHTLLTGVGAMDRMILFLLVVRAAVDHLACLLVVEVANRVEARCA